MKSFLYFMVGLFMLPVIAFNNVRELGENTVSNYKLYKRMDKNLKERA